MGVRATMRDVAALAGVSLKTVSRVVNDETGVSPEMVERVNRAVAQLHYRHNLAASNLRRGARTASLGVLVQDLSNDYSAQLLRAVEDLARERGVVVMSSSLDEEEARERELVTSFIARRVDGLILMPASSDQSYLQNEVRAGLAVVVVDRPPSFIPLDSVAVDNRGGAQTAVRHLVKHGHRRISFIGDLIRIATAAERLAGYEAALAEAGVAFDPALVRLDVRTSDAAQEATEDLLASDHPPTAIFAGRNVNAIGAARALRRLDLAHTVALVGFDDFPMSDLVEPAITVIRQDVAAVGHTAADLLLRRLDGDDGTTSQRGAADHSHRAWIGGDPGKAEQESHSGRLSTPCGTARLGQPGPPPRAPSAADRAAATASSIVGWTATTGSSPARRMTSRT